MSASLIPLLPACSRTAARICWSCYELADGAILPLARHAEIVDSFLHFQIGRKPLLTKLVNRLEVLATDGENYFRTAQLTTELEKYITELSLDLPCDIYCSKMGFGGILRAVGVDIVDDCESDLERLLDYMELTRELEHERLFILVNLRSYYADAEVEAFLPPLLLTVSLSCPLTVFHDRGSKTSGA